MPAPLTFPVGPQFGGVLSPKTVYWREKPPEGDRSVSANILWGTDDNGTGAVTFNLQGISTQEFSRIAALYIDNIQSGADVSFIFQDTQFEMTVPAGTSGLYPVISTATSFVAVASSSIAGDRTYMQILNSLPPPIALAKAVFESVAVNGAIATASGSTAILAAGINGTMTGITVNAINAKGGGTNGLISVVVEDGAANVLAIGAFGLDAGVFLPFGNLLTLSGVNVRFTNGANVVVTATGGAMTGALAVNFYYRTP